MRASEFFVLTIVAGCSAHGRSSTVQANARPAPAVVWQTSIDRAHPLVGRVWDTRGKHFVQAEDVYATLAGADFVLLGEKHDNPDHHALQARALRAIVEKGKKPAVAFEMLEAGEQPTIDAFLKAPAASASGLGAAVAWEKSGWPSYASYEPIFTVAIAAHAPLIAANMPKAEVRAIVHGDFATLDAPSRARLDLDKPLPEAQAAELREEMRATHCGMLPETMFEPMALAQRARDATMGNAMLATTARPVVLIAGAGHARTDRGVPAFLRAHAPAGSKIVSVAFEEVATGVNEPRPLPFDFVWFTPRATDEDPCAKMMGK